VNFKYSILYVENVEKTLSFYEKAFGFKTRFLHEAGDYGELDTGSTSLAFSSLKLMSDMGKQPGKPDPHARTFNLSFETTDVVTDLKRAVDAGAEIVNDVQEQPWGQTTSFVTDINGFLIEICSPVNPS